MQIKNKKGVVLHEVPGDSLVGADLRGAYLKGAILRRADLREAYLRWADLGGADLRKADLRWADLRWADLSGANLSGANLNGANLRGADLREADLSAADLSGALLQFVDLSGASLPPPITPEVGEFLGYKKVLQEDGTYAVITLHIPASAQRTSALTSRKCRASHVVAVDGEGFSPTYEKELHYIAGETVHADGFNSDNREECVQGIHFFMTREEAEAYQP